MTTAGTQPAEHFHVSHVLNLYPTLRMHERRDQTHAGLAVKGLEEQHDGSDVISAL